MNDTVFSYTAGGRAETLFKVISDGVLLRIKPP